MKEIKAGYKAKCVFDMQTLAFASNDTINAQIKVARKEILNAPNRSLVIADGRSWAKGEVKGEYGYEYELVNGKFCGYRNRRYVLNVKNIEDYFGLKYQKAGTTHFVYTASKVWLLVPESENTAGGV